MGRSLALAVSLLVAQLVSATAIAEPREATDIRLERLLRKLEALTEPAADAQPAAAVTRTAVIRVRGTINKKSAFTLPLRCSVKIAHSNAALTLSFVEDMSALVTFAGNTGTCDLTVPFKWQNADTSRKVNVSVSIYIDDCVCAQTEVTRSTHFSFAPILLPGEGTTRLINFIRDM